jgi:hypothetical protein
MSMIARFGGFAMKRDKTCCARLFQHEVNSLHELAISDETKAIIKHIAEQRDVLLSQPCQALSKKVQNLLELESRHAPHPLAEPPRQLKVLEGICHLTSQRTVRVQTNIQHSLARRWMHEQLRSQAMR